MVNLDLFCLVDGESTSSAFSVKISTEDTVDDLKKLIKTEKSPRFDDIAADELTLWRVSLPVGSTDDELPITLDAMADGDKMKLRPTDELSDVFGKKPPKKTIHVVVERPKGMSIGVMPPALCRLMVDILQTG